MGFPNRALLTAPVARDLYAETGRSVARIPGASNGVLQLWDTLDEDYFVERADAAITIYPDIPSIPLAVRKYVLKFLTYTDATASTPRITVAVDPILGNVSVGPWRRWIDCTALDFLKISNGGVSSVKSVTTLIAGDRPQEWDLMHRWAGNVAETLGAP